MLEEGKRRMMHAGLLDDLLSDGDDDESDRPKTARQSSSGRAKNGVDNGARAPLPTDLLTAVLQFLGTGPCGLGIARCVCVLWYDTAGDSELWARTLAAWQRQEEARNCNRLCHRYSRL